MFFDFGFGAVSILFGIIFFVIFSLVIGIVIVIVVKGIGQWNKNNNAPRLTVDALIVAKRIDNSEYQHANAGDISGAQGCYTTVSTSYYVTFQVESGDRIELSVTGSEYGMLAEGDHGKLSFQGTRYLGFKRI